jgi:hypothetical protein
VLKVLKVLKVPRVLRVLTVAAAGEGLEVLLAGKVLRRQLPVAAVAVAAAPRAEVDSAFRVSRS